jgi:hypothetical protein
VFLSVDNAIPTTRFDAKIDSLAVVKLIDPLKPDSWAASNRQKPLTEGI